VPGTRRILSDVNIWLATLVEGHPHHQRVIGWWEEEVIPSGREVCFCRLTQLGLLRLLTNELVMGGSRKSPAQAWVAYEHTLAQPPVVYLDEPPGLDGALRALTRDSSPSPGLWTDAYLAAFAITAGLSLATLDRGFRHFPGLDLILL
jgi:toxin-antitoxin system PIN domain toxin